MHQAEPVTRDLAVIPYTRSVPTHLFQRSQEGRSRDRIIRHQRSGLSQLFPVIPVIVVVVGAVHAGTSFVWNDGVLRSRRYLSVIEFPQKLTRELLG